MGHHDEEGALVTTGSSLIGPRTRRAVLRADRALALASIGPMVAWLFFTFVLPLPLVANALLVPILVSGIVIYFVSDQAKARVVEALQAP